MRFIVVPSRNVKKYLQKCRKNGRLEIVMAIEEVSNLLSVSNAPARFVLRERWKDHALKGDHYGKRELYLNYDELLVYRVYEEQRIIELMDIMSHEELRKRKR